MEDNIMNNVEERAIEQTEEMVTMTKHDYEMELQRNADRRVQQALDTYSKKMEKKISDAEKLRNMSDQQKREYELQERISELEAMTKKYEQAEMKNQLVKTMNERSLPVCFADYLCNGDSEEIMDNLNAFEIVWKKALSDAVKNKIPSSEPKSSSSVGGLTKEDFKHMSLAERQELYDNNPRLYEALKN